MKARVLVLSGILVFTASYLFDISTTLSVLGPFCIESNRFFAPLKGLILFGAYILTWVVSISSSLVFSVLDYYWKIRFGNHLLTLNFFILTLGSITHLTAGLSNLHLFLLGICH